MVNVIPDEKDSIACGFSEMVAEEGFLLARPDGEQNGYRGRYLSGLLSERMNGMNRERKTKIMIYLLGKKYATEFDGEIAYEFKHDFIGSDYDVLAKEARHLLSGNCSSIRLTPSEVKRVKYWLEH